MLILWSLLAVLLLAALGAYICFRMAYYVPEKAKIRPEYELPPGKIYEPYHQQMRKWMEEVRAMPCEEMSITTFDGLTLWGKYYEYAPGAPIELMFHGYRGNAERDLNGGVQRCRKLGRSALLVDQRCSGKSDGHTITFGINEHRDCLAWVDFMVKHFGPDVKILLTGISMGASTVLFLADEPLPGNVRGIIADCGFCSPAAIISKVFREVTHLPAGPSVFCADLFARLFAGFSLYEKDSRKTLAKARLPVLLIHGSEDHFVPCSMTEESYAACTGEKALLLVDGAGHGVSFLVDHERYSCMVEDFLAKNLEGSH